MPLVDIGDSLLVMKRKYHHQRETADAEIYGGKSVVNENTQSCVSSRKEKSASSLDLRSGIDSKIQLLAGCLSKPVAIIHHGGINGNHAGSAAHFKIPMPQSVQSE
jgi:hypothetical protein